MKDSELMDLVRSYLIALDRDRQSPGHFTLALQAAEERLRDAATKEDGVTAESLTLDQTRSLFASISNDATYPEIANACRIVLGMWKRNEADTRTSREKVAAAINARCEGPS